MFCMKRVIEMARHAFALMVAVGIGSFAALALSQPARAPAQATAPQPATSLPPAAPVSQDPDRTTAVFGDWLLRCERQATGQRECDVVQTLSFQGQAQPIALIAVTRPTRGQPLQLSVQVPVSTTLTSALRLTGDGRDALLVELSWARCIPAGCFADVQLRDETVLRRLRARTEPGRIEFRDGANEQIQWPFSVRGLGPALDALARE